jgi:hypothetical protein
MNSRRPSLRSLIGTGLLVASVVAAGAACDATSSVALSANQSTSQSVGNQAAAPARPTAVCGSSILHSPWWYDGKAGTYGVGHAPRGLPSFGAAKTSFPWATKIIVVPAGNNTVAGVRADYQVNDAIVYFEPGVHQMQEGMYTGHNSVYLGGYNPSRGVAVIDGVAGATNGTGRGGARLAESAASAGNNVYDWWEFLTIKNFTSSLNNSVMGNVNGGGTDIGDVYRYDTIGPNEYSYKGGGDAPATGQSSGGGYAIDAGSYTIIEYDCLTHNAQGAFNAFNVNNIKIDHNEISWNGIGEYPDISGPGGSPYTCGCSGGGKIFYSLNADVVGNYVHNNYNDGIWFDTDNAGANISGNYIASNWGAGIAYEASYNANISDNTLVGNGWASNGAWPAGIGGRPCYNGVSCTNGFGPITGAGGGNAYAAIDLSNSGGNSNLRVYAGTLASRYSGEVLVEGNVLRNNFGGVKVYTDTDRYPGNIDNDSTCTFPLGVLDRSGSKVYYQQSKVLTTASDADVSGTAVTTVSGTTSICADYGTVADDGTASVLKTPSVGMAVFNLNSGKFLGKVTAVSSAHAFTISAAVGKQSGLELLLSAYGGCGPADYYGGARGVASGTPRADYWDNCLWASRNVTVKGNTFSINAATLKGCAVTRNLCGVMYEAAFDPGIPQLMRFWSSYETYIAKAKGGLGNVWSHNTYEWPSDTSQSWRFWAGQQGVQVSRARWQGGPYEQDAGSVFR